jgi:hypothetical protein
MPSATILLFSIIFSEFNCRLALIKRISIITPQTSVKPNFAAISAEMPLFLPILCLDVFKKVWLMKHIARYITFLSLILLLAGCVSVRSIRYESAAREPRPDCPIEILDAKNINKPYRVIGQVEAAADERINLAKIMNKLRDAARKMGGEALTDLQHQSVGTGVPVSQDGSLYLGYVRDLWSAKVIVWGKTGDL